MAWFDQFARNLGSANSPFGFAPDVSPSQGPVDPAYGAGMSMLGDIGMRMLASGSRNPTQALGAAYIGAQDNARQKNKENYAAQQLMAQAEENRRKREEEAQRQKWMDEQISQLPADQQGLARMMPDKFFGNQIDSMFQPAGASGGNAGNWGMSAIPLINSKGEYTVGQFNQGMGGVFVNGQPIDGTDWRPYDPGQLAQVKAANTKLGGEQGGAAAAIPGAEIDNQAMNATIDLIANNPNLGDAIGYGNVLSDYLVSNDVLEIRSQLNKLEGVAFLSAYNTLKGGGQITEMESSQAKQAIADMKTARKMNDVEKFKTALEQFRTSVNQGMQKLRAQAGQYAPGGVTGGDTGGGAEEWEIGPDGKPRRKQ